MKLVPQSIGLDDIPAFDRFTVGRSRLRSGDNAQRSDDRVGRDGERDNALRFIVLVPSVATHGESRSEPLTVVPKGIPGMPGIWIVIPRHAPGWPRHYSLDSSATSRVANARSAHHAARELRLTGPLRGQAGAEMSDQCGQRPASGRTYSRATEATESRDREALGEAPQWVVGTVRTQVSPSRSSGSEAPKNPNHSPLALRERNVRPVRAPAERAGILICALHV
jgi:hypothetical protein